MADLVETGLTYLSDVLSVAGVFYPPALVFAKLAGYAAAAEPVAVQGWDIIKAHLTAGTLNQAHVDHATALVADIEAKQLAVSHWVPQGRGGGSWQAQAAA